jgi:hypothetical protein
MQNSFEKQVREKMDELKFVPTPPVWQNIEKQIRAKKDRRRVFLWLPLFVLLLGGGVWWVLSGIQKKDSIAIVNQKDRTEIKERQTVEKKVQKDSKEYKGEKVSHAKTIPSSTGDRASQKERITLTTSFSGLILIKQKPSPAVGSNPNISTSKVPASPQDSSSEVEQNNKLEKAANANHKIVLQQNFNADFDKNSKAQDSSVQLKVAGIKRDKVDTVISVAEKKTLHSKWQSGFIASGGIAGVSKGLNVFSADKAMFDSYSTASGSFNPAPRPSAPSPIENGLFFSFGVMVKRQLNNRLSFATGLEYQYYSNQMAVGQLRRQDTLVAQSSSRIVNQFYLNSGSDFSDYHNQFHFIALPVALDWRVLRKAPLHVQAGFSLQQLISTNALIYDGGSGIYYSDNSAFHKMQLFSRLGLSYAVLNNKKSSFRLGPQLQYGLTRLGKNNSGYHLFSVGLSAQFLFQKK